MGLCLSGKERIDTNVHIRTNFQKRNYDCGCLALSKEGSNDNSEPSQLPLKKILYDITIINGVAEVTINQTYVNPGNSFLELQYRFPIVPQSCIHKFTATFSKLRMEGVVKEKETAKIEYQEAVKLGKRAALGDIDPESKDILTLQIGNLGPGQEVTIELSYTEELTLSLNTFYQFNLVTQHIPRYVNSVPPQDYLNAFRRSVKTVAGSFEWDFKVRLKATRKIKSFKSISHSLIVEKHNDQNTDLSLTLEKGEPFSKGFSLIYTTEDFQLPSYTLGRTDAGSSVMVSFIPKFCSLDIKDAELAAIKAQSFQTDMDAVRGEYVFLLDRSGSMSGQAIEKAKEALILFLKSLPIDTYFQVVSFGSEDQKLFDTSQKNSNESISEAITRIGRMQADMGGTQIYRPLQEILQSQLIEGYPKQIFMLTDGGVSNTESVIELVKSNTKYSRVNTIGIGSGVSQSLILRCAQEGKGSHVFIQQNENPSQKIIQMLNNSLSPVISKIHLNYDKNIVQSIIPNPQKLPYFLKGEIVSFFITFKNHLTQKTQISLSYIDSLNNYPFKSSLTIQPEEQNQLFVEKLTNYRKIKALEQSESSKSNLQDYMYFVKKVDKKEQIINLSVKHQILSKYTAFICQEKELVDGKFQQIKDKGKQKIQIVQVNQKIYKRQSEGFFQSLSSMIPMKMMSYDMSPESCQVKQCFENKEVRQQYSRKFQLRMQYYNQDLFDNQIEIHQQNKQKEGWDIKRIVKEQLFDGSWSNKEIISELYSSSILSQLNILKEQKIGITYLITIWIQKHHPSNEYNLIVKKARNWLKKQQNYAQLSSQFDKYLK